MQPPEIIRHWIISLKEHKYSKRNNQTQSLGVKKRPYHTSTFSVFFFFLSFFVSV